MPAYRCVTTSVQGFVQQLAVSYLTNGYWFYVCGWIPEHKDAMTVDRKLMARYGIDVSKWARARRKQAGISNVHYLRHGRFFVLLATRGEHVFFRDEAVNLRDARRVPVKYGGYSMSFRGGHAHVRIERSEYLRMKAHFLHLAVHRRAESIAEAFARLPFEPYAPVRRQLLNILRAMNFARGAAGFSVIPFTVLRFHRRIVRPFEKNAQPSLEASGEGTPTDVQYEIFSTSSNVSASEV